MASYDLMRKHARISQVTSDYITRLLPTVSDHLLFYFIIYRSRSLITDILQHLSSHPLPLLHYLHVLCWGDSDVRALRTFLPQCTNLRTLHYALGYNSDVSENVEEKLWEIVARRCRNLEEVRVSGDDSYVSCDRLLSVLMKLSNREGIQALNLKRIMRIDWYRKEVIEDYTEQVKHLLPALQQQAQQQSQQQTQQQSQQQSQQQTQQYKCCCLL